MIEKMELYLPAPILMALQNKSENLGVDSVDVVEALIKALTEDEISIEAVNSIIRVIPPSHGEGE